MTTVYLARGHGVQPSGVHDPGAAGGGWTEQTAVDVVAPVVTEMLEQAGVEVVDEGVDDPNYVGSVAAANAAGVDLFVALHFDWTGGLDPHAFHHSASSDGRRLAGGIMSALRTAGFTVEEDPVRARDGLYVIGKTRMTAVLAELGRIGDPANDEPAELQRLGRAVAYGILSHLRLTPPEDYMPLTDDDVKRVGAEVARLLELRTVNRGGSDRVLSSVVTDSVFQAGWGRQTVETFEQRFTEVWSSVLLLLARDGGDPADLQSIADTLPREVAEEVAAMLSRRLGGQT